MSRPADSLARFRADLRRAGWEPTEIMFLDAIGNTVEGAARWRALDDEVRAEHDRDERLYDEPWPQRRGGARPAVGARTARLTGSGGGDGDPLRAISPNEYVEALTGEPVPASGLMRCPLPGHPDANPSFHIYSDHVWCFGCQRGGSIYGFAAAFYGLEPRGRDFPELRRRIAAALLRGDARD